MSQPLKKHDLLGIGMTSQRRRDQLAERLLAKGVQDTAVLKVIRTMPRHLFVDEAMANRAYEDCALPIGYGQTISQPYIVARMTEAILSDDDKDKPRTVLEIGTGSGYQAAILSMLVDTVYSVERIEKLYNKTRRLFNKLHLGNIRTKHDDGNIGWEEHSPYDAIIVTAAIAQIPQALIDQLADGGRMVIPVGEDGTTQSLMLLTRKGSDIETDTLDLVSFVPFLTGRS